MGLYTGIESAFPNFSDQCTKRLWVWSLVDVIYVTEKDKENTEQNSILRVLFVSISAISVIKFDIDLRAFQLT